ncbi:M28 family metallopeptidase [Hahella ganghwensis]|uniref:M28 family metallopeptidase n=1 Tax=Hahella ganghwensis TaxID=286420 RepID=UPI000375C9D8|nr:M28 family metallopeptidase [Hahella ganghwensis]
MTADNIKEHLEMLNDIARANNGTRAAGLKGYDDSVDYVMSTLEKAGYKPKLDTFPFNAFYPQGPGILKTVAGDSGTEYEFEADFNYLTQTEGGDVTAMVEAVDLDLGPDNASTSGCEPEDFDGFTAGNIALIQRGACSFQQKAENAAAAGAVGAIIFNQGNSDDRKGLINATLSDGYSGGIPVFFATYDNGVAWTETKDLSMQMVADVIRVQTETVNVIAETHGGDPDNVVMVGAHLDSVFEGAGVNDNGSGSAAILEMAIQMRRAHVHNKVRFAWWGAEEAGLVGSTDYVLNLSQEEKEKIKVYLNFDMIASPNFAYMIYDGDGSDFDLEGPPGSKATEMLFEEYFKIRGLPSEGTQISFRSDYAQFFEEGIAFGGLFTGAEVPKTEEQAAKYGGDAGVALDYCYHAACDDINNLNLEALEINADAAAFVTSWFARTTRIIDEEIEAANAPTMFRMMSSKVAYDKTHWGKYWIK